MSYRSESESGQDQDNGWVQDYGSEFGSDVRKGQNQDDGQKQCEGENGGVFGFGDKQGSNVFVPVLLKTYISGSPFGNGAYPTAVSTPKTNTDEYLRLYVST